MREKKIFFVYMAASVYHVRKLKIASLDTIAFLGTHVCISNPDSQSSEIIIFWCRYYIVISDTLIGSWIYFCCSWLQCYQSFMKNQEGKIEQQKKVHRRIYMRNITFLAACPPSYVIFYKIVRVMSSKRN